MLWDYAWNLINQTIMHFFIEAKTYKVIYKYNHIVIKFRDVFNNKYNQGNVISIFYYTISTLTRVSHWMDIWIMVYEFHVFWINTWERSREYSEDYKQVTFNWRVGKLCIRGLMTHITIEYTMVPVSKQAKYCLFSFVVR